MRGVIVAIAKIAKRFVNPQVRKGAGAPCEPWYGKIEQKSSFDYYRYFLEVRFIPINVADIP